ncbi:hypothetical protein HWV00_13710 [Moritella sp. 24]|uniref:hypothetical protein n=1 Tax=Moritella sp. 24 TaxID=2746230 RepID=UPI001BAD27A4|nr:hypothetical protein [Moritella sp. 24]QUM77203.1 hypothetical protein HWV00_13710 [Moritella sp. 24]
MNAKQSACLAACILISACSSTSQQPDSTSINFLNDGLFSNTNLYGYLEKDKNGSYYFSKFISNKNSLNSFEPWVSLNNMDPLFTTKEYNCATGGLLGDASGDNHKICDSDDLNDTLFRSTNVSAGDLAQTTIGNAAYIALSFGLGAFSAEGHYTSEFDRDAYAKAVNEASSKANLNKLDSDLNAFSSYKSKQEKELIVTINNKHLKLNDSLKINFIDNSKLYDLKFKKEKIKIDKADVNTSLHASNIVFSDIEELYQKLNKQIKEKKDNVTFNVSCNTSQFRLWSLSTKGCNKSFDLTNNVSSIPVTYTVENKREFKVNYFPAIEDKVISLYSDGYQIIATNKTDSFLDIKTLSMYVGNKIETQSNLKIEIPPRARITVAQLHSFNRTQDRLVLKNVIKRDVQKNISVGSAIKYVIVDTDSEKTLFETNNIKPLQYR